MPKLSTIGQTNRVAHITKDSLAGGSLFIFSAEDSEAHIEFMPTGGLTIVLPGPTAIPPPPRATPNSGDVPNDGDYYAWKDPLGLVSNANPLTLLGGGFKFGVAGQPTSLVFTAAFTGLGAEFTFNDSLGLWVGCGCGPVQFSGG
jgi:hypothetical protein